MHPNEVKLETASRLGEQLLALIADGKLADSATQLTTMAESLKALAPRVEKDEASGAAQRYKERIGLRTVAPEANQGFKFPDPKKEYKGVI